MPPLAIQLWRGLSVCRRQKAWLLSREIARSGRKHASGDAVANCRAQSTVTVTVTSSSLDHDQWRQREFKVGGTNHRMGWGVEGD